MKKILGILLLIVLVGGPVLVVGVPVVASNATWYVDGSLGEDVQGKGTGPGGDAFATIQYAIDHAGEGDTVVVAAGLHKENVVIDKSLTLEGAQVGVDARDRSGAETIIEPDDPSEQTAIEIVGAANRVVVIDGLTVLNARHGITAPLHPESADIAVRNVRALNMGRFAITMAYTRSAAIQYCYVEDAEFGINAGAGVGFDPTVATFTNNEVVNAKFGISGYLADSLIQGNLVWCKSRDGEASEGVGISGQFVDTEVRNNTVKGYEKGAGMSFEWHYGRYLSRDVRVEGNTFTGNRLGIYVFDTQSKLERIAVNFNSIFGNSAYGVRNDGSETLDATGNWWGHAGGPGGLGPGDRDRVGARVLYSPWLSAEPGTAPMAWGVDPTGSIQHAVDLANSGDTIIVTEGEYREDLDIGKSLTIRSANGAEATAIIGSLSVNLTDEIVCLGGDGAGLTVKADDRDYALRLCLGDGSWVTVRENIFAGATAGVDTSPDGIGDSSTVTISYNRILQNSDYGIYLASIGAGSTVVVNSNDIAENGNNGLYVGNGAVAIDATNNWWGHETGPYHSVDNIGGEGNAVTGNVTFQPWLDGPLCTLRVSSDARGAVPTPGERTFVYTPGTEVALEATPNAGYGFDRWTGDVDTIADVRAALTTIVVDDDYSINARFTSMMCFVASAAYGTDAAEEIEILREFRDTVLVSNSLGAGLVSFYYTTSPFIAGLAARYEVLRLLLKSGFVGPLVSVLTQTHGLWSTVGRSGEQRSGS